MDNRKPLHYYLEDLSRLQEISLAELEQWSNELPYVQNIRLLIAKKHQQQGSTENLSPFHLAATYSIDRSRLYEVLNENESSIKETVLPEVTPPEQITKTEVVASPTSAISIDPIQELSQALSISSTQRIQEEVVNGHHDTEHMPVVDEDLEISKIINIIESAEPKYEPIKKEIKSNINTINSKKVKEKVRKKNKKKKGIKSAKTDSPKSVILHITPDTLSEEKPKEKEKKKTAKKKKKKSTSMVMVSSETSAYTQWLLSLRMANSGDIPYIDWSENSERELKKKPKKQRLKKDAKIRAMAERSVQEREEIVSEALADLLLAQGHNKKAKKMYKQLSLIFPEKSSFFAAKIDQIKKNI